jgi:hypothetical protein
MIIVFGVRTKFIKSIPVLHEVCSSCGQAGTTSIVYYQRYFHLIWIPTIPLGKVYYAVCSHCKQTLDKTKMSASLREFAEREKANIKTPLKYYLFPLIWVALIGGVIIAGFVGSYFADKDRNTYVLDPKVNDVYIVEGKNNKYLPLKVEKVEGDKITFQLGKYEYANGSDAEDDKAEADYYSSDEDTYTKQELKDLNVSGQIYSIQR